MRKVTKLKLAWKYRRFLWKYRNLIRHRREIAVMAASGAIIVAAVWMKRAERG